MQCAVCLDRTQLRVTNCGNNHSFCIKCLRQLRVTHGRQFPCPLCRQQIHITSRDASNFPVLTPSLLAVGNQGRWSETPILSLQKSPFSTFQRQVFEQLHSGGSSVRDSRPFLPSSSSLTSTYTPRRRPFHRRQSILPPITSTESISPAHQQDPRSSEIERRVGRPVSTLRIDQTRSTPRLQVSSQRPTRPLPPLGEGEGRDEGSRSGLVARSWHGQRRSLRLPGAQLPFENWGRLEQVAVDGRNVINRPYRNGDVLDERSKALILNMLVQIRDPGALQEISQEVNQRARHVADEEFARTLQLQDYEAQILAQQRRHRLRKPKGSGTVACTSLPPTLRVRPNRPLERLTQTRSRQVNPHWRF